MIHLLTLVNHDVLRESLEELFEWAGDIRISAVATSAEECMKHLAADAERRFHGLLLDTAHAAELRLLVELMGEALLELPILALCPKNTPQFVREALSTGNAVYLEKDGDPMQLVATIRAAAAAHTGKRKKWGD